MRQSNHGKILAGLALGILLFSGFAYLWSSDASPAAVSYSRMPFASIEPSSPFIQSAFLEPLKVRPGDLMQISAQVSDPSGVSQVSAGMGGIETIPLSSGTAYAGILQAGGCNYG